MPAQFPGQPASATNRDFLTDALVRHGPPTLLGRFFLQAARFARQKNITLRLCQPDELLVVNRRNRENWLPLAPCYDPSFNALDEKNYIGLLGEQPNGDITTANAIRLYDWSDTNFGAEARSLRLMYDVPRVSKQKNEYCEVTAPSAGEIKGQAAFSGAAWVHPEMRGHGLGHLLPLVIKALAVTKWWPDVIFGVMSDRVHAAGFAKPFGFDHEEVGINWLNSPLGNLRLTLLWTTCEQVIQDTQRLIDTLDPKVEGIIRNRYTGH